MSDEQKGLSGIETMPPTVFELKCACGKVCGQLTWPGGVPVDLEKVADEHITVCDDCKK